VIYDCRCFEGCRSSTTERQCSLAFDFLQPLEPKNTTTNGLEFEARGFLMGPTLQPVPEKELFDVR